jgi:lipoprotein-anchoring transpeptidase ErfK/SrfK
VGDPTPPSPTNAYLAQLVFDGPLHSGPADSTSVTGSVSTKTKWGGATQLLVLDSARTAGSLWLDVRVQGRPNGNHGWISADLAQLSSTPFRIEVSRAAKSLTLFKAGAKVRTIKVVVGAPGTPTPAGNFSIADKLQLSTKGDFLGNFVLPLTAYSDILKKFDGGPGQVALHGRGGASLKVPVGTAASHGCVRIENAQIAKIAAAVPTGTPVNIS